MTDLRQLRALLAVADEGTFTDAAIALRTSQASVSRAVAELERTLGARLLLRTSRGARPTVLGRRVAEHARRVLAEIALIERLGDQTTAQLRVGFAWSVFGRLTTPIQRQWQDGHGSVTFVQSNTPTAGLLEGEVDLAVIRRPLSDRRFETSLVGAEARYAALAVDDPLVRRRRLSLGDLRHRPVAIDRATGTTTTELWPSGAAPTDLHEVHGMEEWLTVVAAGEAVGITSEATADQFPRPGIRYRPVMDAPPIAVWLVWWRDDPPAGASAFRQLVCERYAERS
ncbi:MAG TPA: LysR family transcriptional regulator [Microlunatus sp.]